MKLSPLTATSLRLALSVSLFVVAILGSIGFYFVHKQLKTVAVGISHTVMDANASQNNVQTLQKIQTELSDKREVVERANSIVADSQSYQYQDQIISDLNNYASRAGIVITNMDFAPTAQGTTTPGVPAAPQPTKPAPSGVKSTSVSVTIKNPVTYTTLLRFIKSIEQNLTKMQISRVSLTKDAKGGEVSSEAFVIEVYVR